MAGFDITLELVSQQPQSIRFRVAFHSSNRRWLLIYPEVTGFCFRSVSNGGIPEWGTNRMSIAPQDEFVLNPQDRIAFDLLAEVNSTVDVIGWRIQLEPGEYEVHYQYTVSPENTRYDYLGKGSRFADITPPWTGTVESNVVRVTVTEEV